MSVMSLRARCREGGIPQYTNRAYHATDRGRVFWVTTMVQALSTSFSPQGACCLSGTNNLSYRALHNCCLLLLPGLGFCWSQYLLLTSINILMYSCNETKQTISCDTLFTRTTVNQHASRASTLHRSNPSLPLWRSGRHSYQQKDCYNLH